MSISLRSHDHPDRSHTSIWPTAQLQPPRPFHQYITLPDAGHEHNYNMYDFLASLLVYRLSRLFSALIVFRIWKIRSKIGLGQLFDPNSPLTNVVIVLIESGLLYTLSIIILVGLYLASNNGQYGVSNSVRQKIYLMSRKSNSRIFPTAQIVQIIVSFTPCQGPFT